MRMLHLRVAVLALGLVAIAAGTTGDQPRYMPKEGTSVRRTFDGGRPPGSTFNFAKVYDLSDALAGIDPHPIQGWHVTLTVNTDGSHGADVKHKTFWTSGCSVYPMPPSPNVPGPGSSNGKHSASTQSVSISHRGRRPIRRRPLWALAVSCSQ